MVKVPSDCMEFHIKQTNYRLNSIQGHFVIHEIIQDDCSAMRSCLQNYDHLFPPIQPCSQLVSMQDFWPGCFTSCETLENNINLAIMYTETINRGMANTGSLIDNTLAVGFLNQCKTR